MMIFKVIQIIKDDYYMKIHLNKHYSRWNAKSVSFHAVRLIDLNPSIPLKWLILSPSFQNFNRSRSSLALISVSMSLNFNLRLLLNFQHDSIIGHLNGTLWQLGMVYGRTRNQLIFQANRCKMQSIINPYLATIRRVEYYVSETSLIINIPVIAYFIIHMIHRSSMHL